MQRTAWQQESADCVKGLRIGGFDSTSKRMRALVPGVRLGHGLRHALRKLPRTRTAIASPVRKALRSQFQTLRHRARQRKGLRVLALRQQLRRFAEHGATTAGAAHGRRVGQWCQEKKAGWSVVLEAPAMPVTSTWLNQAHTVIDQKLFMMKALHHPKGHQQALLRGLAHLYHLVLYQRRAQQAGHWGVEVEGGTVPTRDWLLNLPILTSGGFRGAVTRSTTKSDGIIHADVRLHPIACNRYTRGHVILSAGSHDTRLGRERAWLKVPSRTHLFSGR